MCVSTLLERCWASDGPSPCGSKHLVILLFFSMNIWNCSLECNSSNRDIVPTLLLQFLWPGTRIEACFARPAGCLSIALPLSAAYSPRGDRIATQPQPAITPTSPPQQHRQDSAPQDPIGKAPPRPQDLRISKTPPRPQDLRTGKTPPEISARLGKILRRTPFSGREALLRLSPPGEDPAPFDPPGEDSAPYSAQDSLLRPRSSAPFVSARRSPAPFVSARRSPAPFLSPPGEALLRLLTSTTTMEDDPPTPPPLASPVHTLELPYPEDATHPFRCPVCNTSYKVYTSFTRHLQTRHEGMVALSFRCVRCATVYASKRSASTHHSRAHRGEALTSSAAPLPPAPATSTSSSFTCSYCSQSYPSRRSLGQHIRNSHPAEASRDRARAAAEAPRPDWSPAEHSLFLDAMERFGPASNVPIARAVGTRSVKQVANHKRTFLRNNPCGPPITRRQDQSEEPHLPPAHRPPPSTRPHLQECPSRPDTCPSWRDGALLARPPHLGHCPDSPRQQHGSGGTLCVVGELQWERTHHPTVPARHHHLPARSSPTRASLAPTWTAPPPPGLHRLLLLLLLPPLLLPPLLLPPLQVRPR